MKRIVAVILISLLVAPPASAGQKPGKPITWEKTQQLKAGTEIMLTVKDSPPTKVKVLFADDSLLVTFQATDPKLPGKVQRALLEVGDRWPSILNSGTSVARDEVRVSSEGIFDGDQKVAELAAVVQQTPRGDVLGISEAPHSHQVRNVIIGVVVTVAVIVTFAMLRDLSSD